MSKFGAGLGSLGVALGLATAFAFTADAAPPAGTAGQPQGQVSDDLPNPEETKRRELREAAIKQVLAGRRRCRTATAARSSGWARPRLSPVRRPRTSTSSSRARRRTRSSSCWPSSATSARPGLPGPGHEPEHPGAGDLQRAAAQQDPGARPRPRTTRRSGRRTTTATTTSSSTSARATASSRVKTYYERQSSGRYSVDGQVTDWVKVRYNEARYGRSDGYPCATNVCSNTWDLIQDAIDTWVADQHAKGRTDDQIKADLATYDQWDRNDFDHDGNFNEPDGYIDHFQIVHAGGDQADGDPQQGEDAIWSHRWKAFQNTGQGPTGNKDGGTQIGDDRPVGRRLHDPARERRHLGLRARVRPRPRPAGRVRHRRRQRRQLVDADGPEPHVGRRRRGDRHPRGRPRRVGQAAARLARLRDRRRGPDARRSTSARTSATPPRRRASSWCCRRRRVTSPLGAPAAGAKQWWSGTGDDYDATLSPAGRRARRDDDAVLPGALEHRGLRAGRVRLRVRRGRRRDRLQGDPGLDHQAPPRATASTACQQRLQAGDVRPVGVRGQDGLAALPLQDRPGAAGQRRRRPIRRASSSTRSS